MNQLKTGAVVSYISLILNLVIGLLYTPWMINTIGKADYGLYTLATSVISLFVFDFGLGSAIVRFVSKYLAEGRQDKVDNILGLVFKLYLAGDIIILIGLCVVYFYLPDIYKGLTPDEIERFKVVFIIASMSCVISFPFIPLSGILKSYEQFIQLNLCDLIMRVITVIFMTGCLIMGWGLFTLVSVNLASGIILIILKLIVFGKKRIGAINWKFHDRILLKEVFSFSVWVTVVQLAQRCIFNIAPSILAVYENSISVTILGVAICLEGYTFTIANAINGMFLPKVSRMVANNDRNAILDLMTRIGRIQIYIVGLVCVGFICVGKYFIQAWMGDGFDEVFPCAVLIILPSFLQLPQEIGCSTVIAEGKVKYQAIAFVIMALLNLALALPFTKYYGVKGLCFSIMLAYIVRTICLDYIFYKHLNINVFRFFKSSYLKILPSLLASGFISILAIKQIYIVGWFGFSVKSVCCFVIYLLINWFFAMNNEEKALILEPFNKFRIK